MLRLRRICRDRGRVLMDYLADVFSEVAEIRLKFKYFIPKA